MRSNRVLIPEEFCFFTSEKRSRLLRRQKPLVRILKYAPISATKDAGSGTNQNLGPMSNVSRFLMGETSLHSGSRSKSTGTVCNTSRDLML